MNPSAILTLPGDCKTCRGRGELAVLGTFGVFMSPEDLETVPCYDCDGFGVPAEQYVIVDGDGDWLISEPCREPEEALYDYLYWGDAPEPRPIYLTTPEYNLNFEVAIADGILA